MERNKYPIKCSICGKFIAFKEIENNKILIDFIPDSEISIETFTHTHKKCHEKHSD